MDSGYKGGRPRLGVKPGNVTLFPEDWEDARRMARKVGAGSISAGLRAILAEWRKLKEKEAK